MTMTNTKLGCGTRTTPGGPSLGLPRVRVFAAALGGLLLLGSGVRPALAQSKPAKSAISAPAPSAPRNPTAAAPGAGAAAAAAADAPKVKVERGAGGHKVYRITEEIRIEGKIQKPEAFFFYQKSNMGYDWEELKQDFVPRILDSVSKAPF